MDNVHKVLKLFFLIYIYTHGMNIFEREKEKEIDREEFLISLIFSKKKNTKKRNFYTVVMCSLLIFLCIVDYISL